MKTFILSEKAFKGIKKTIMNESYGDKVTLVKKFLDDNFMRASIEQAAPNGTRKSIGIFVQLNDKHLPTESSMWFDDVIDMLNSENNFMNIISNEKERDGFLRQVVRDWYDNKISKYGTLSSYGF